MTQPPRRAVSPRVRRNRRVAALLPVALWAGAVTGGLDREPAAGEAAEADRRQAVAAAFPASRTGRGPAGDRALTPAVDAATAVLSQARSELRAFPAEWPIVRGVYATRWSFAGQRWNELVDLIRDTELNAIVIDVKDDRGELAWKNSSVELAHAVGADANTALTKERATARLRQLRQAGGYPIARVVCFKDAVLAPARPALAIRTRGGAVWRDRKGLAWLDANNRATWDYILDVSREAAAMGFLEVQFDYVRFPTDGNLDDAVYASGGGVDPRAIRRFLAYAREELHRVGVRLSADIFGLTTYKQEGTGDGDGTGQRFEDISAEVDYVSPMVYPSHYYRGNYGLKNPEANPYAVVFNAMREAQQRVRGYRARVRPWLEDFSLRVEHHPGRVSAQLKATYDSGIDSWLLWSARNTYSRSALAARTRSRAAPLPSPAPSASASPTASSPAPTPTASASGPDA